MYTNGKNQNPTSTTINIITILANFIALRKILHSVFWTQHADATDQKN